MTVQSIDTQQFVVANGQLGTIQNRTQVISRPGVDGSIVRRDGQIGSVFTLRTMVDVLDVEEGRERFREYEALVGGNAVDLIWNDFDMNAEEIRKVCVLGVQQERLSFTPTRSGGFSKTNKWTLIANWRLLMVDAS